MANLTVLTLRAVFRLALRQTKGLIGSVTGLLGLDLAVPDHSTLSRRSEMLEVPRPQARRDGEPLHLLVDSTGLKLCGAGEWLIEKRGTRTRRSPRKLHIGLDADTGQIVAVALTTKDVDDGAEVGPLLDQVRGFVTSFTADGDETNSLVWFRLWGLQEGVSWSCRSKQGRRWRPWRLIPNCLPALSAARSPPRRSWASSRRPTRRPAPA